MKNRGEIPWSVCCCLRNIQDLLSDGKTPYERWFGMPSHGSVIPFGAVVEYHPISARELSRLHQFWSKSVVRFFLGYALYAERNWKGDIMVADNRSWKRWPHQKSTQGGSMQSKLLTPRRSGNFIFPVADGKVELSGGDQVLKTSTLIRDSLERGERQDLRGESDGSPPQDSLPGDGEARNGFWSSSENNIYRHHVEPRVKLHVPREESFPIALRKKCRDQNYKYDVGCDA